VWRATSNRGRIIKLLIVQEILDEEHVQKIWCDEAGGVRHDQQAATAAECRAV
jgi:hypothetical protein